MPVFKSIRPQRKNDSLSGCNVSLKQFYIEQIFETNTKFEDATQKSLKEKFGYGKETEVLAPSTGTELMVPGTIVCGFRSAVEEEFSNCPPFL